MSYDVLDVKQSDLYFDGWRQAEKTITFDGGTANAIGDVTGTSNPFDIFTVTGDVVIKVVGICKTTLVGAATLEVGTTASTAGILAQVADATAIAANDIWHDATVDATVELFSVMLEKIITNGLDIIGTVGTADITAGVIKFICLWKPLSIDGKVVSA